MDLKGVAAYNYYRRCRPILAVREWKDCMTFGMFVQLLGRSDRRGPNGDLKMFLYSEKEATRYSLRVALLEKDTYPKVTMNILLQNLK